MGDGSIPNALQESLEVISLAGLSAVGILLDADSAIQPLERFNKLKTAVTAHVSNWPNEPGAIDQGPPRTGIFVLPDNTSSGTLEDLLIESAEVTWPPLLGFSQEFVKAGIELTDALDKAERDQLRRPSGPNKATVGCLANLFRPGKSVQVSIHDNDWVSAKSVGLPRMNALKNFLYQLIGTETVA